MKKLFVYLFTALSLLMTPYTYAEGFAPMHDVGYVTVTDVSDVGLPSMHSDIAVFTENTSNTFKTKPATVIRRAYLYGKPDNDGKFKITDNVLFLVSGTPYVGVIAV